MDEARRTKLKRRATRAIEGSRGDGFAELVMELLEESKTGNLPYPPSQTEQTPASQYEMEVVSELDPTPTPKRQRKVAEAGGDLSGSD